jgi:two-component system nitrogen regulation response regulator GlnG
MNYLKSILVVDDEEDLTWSISKSLAKNNSSFEVFSVNNGDSALAVLASRRVDLVISDLRRPGRDGLSLLRDIQRDYPSTRVIIMTAHGSEDLCQELTQCGLSYYIEKPFDMRYLHQLIHEALNLSEAKFEGIHVNWRIHKEKLRF